MMKLRSIPQLFRNSTRAVEVISILIKYGLADWVSRLGVEFPKDVLKNSGGEALARLSRETRVRLALTEAGPTFIKFGQVLSTRPDLIGASLANELQRLQDAAPADAPEDVRNTIENSLHQPLESLYAQFDLQPMASASIGQVHRAQLPDGRRVVVKVRHTGIETKVRTDLDILVVLAQLAERLPELAFYRPKAVAAEFQRVLLRELDFSREARSQEHFASQFARDRRIRIPHIDRSRCSSAVITMDLLEGIRLNEREQLVKSGCDLAGVARNGAEIYLEMIFYHGLYHADPHPGNIVILENDVIGLVDFGMVGRIDERLREDIGDMLLAIGSGDAAHLTSLIMRVGEVPSALDSSALESDLQDFVSHYTAQQIDEIDLTAALTELIELIRRYRITLPTQMAMLLKVLLLLEGTSRLLNPTFCLAEVMAPYQRRMLLRRLSPARHARKLWRIYSELEHLLEMLPRGVLDILEQVQSGKFDVEHSALHQLELLPPGVLDILEQVQSGKFDVHLDHRGLEPSVNRLAMGMLASALFLGSAWMLSQQVPPVVGLPWMDTEVSLLGSVGCLTGLAMGIRLMWAIARSGHLDRRG